MTQLIPLAFAVGSVSFIISKSTMPIVSAVRGWVSARSQLLRDLLKCPFCTSNWVAAIALLICRPTPFLHTPYVWADWFFTWQALVGAAMIPIFGIFFIAGK